MATKPTRRRVAPTKTVSKNSSAKRKICNACGAANVATASACVKCGKTRFAPSWVRELRRINRSFAVQVTDPHPSAESNEPRLTLHKRRYKQYLDALAQSA